MPTLPTSAAKNPAVLCSLFQFSQSVKLISEQYFYIYDPCLLFFLSFFMSVSFSKQSQSPLSLQDFRLIAVLGRGHFGKVQFIGTSF